MHSPLTGTEPFLQTKLTLVGQWQEAGWVAVEIYLQVQVRAQIPLGSQQPPGPEVLIYLLMQEGNKKDRRKKFLAATSKSFMTNSPLLLLHFSCKFRRIMHIRACSNLCTNTHCAVHHSPGGGGCGEAIFQTLLTPHFAAIVLYYTE